jgi:hypothetical protein
MSTAAIATRGSSSRAAPPIPRERASRASALALLAAAWLATPALAAERGCRTIRALTNADRRDFADLRIAIGPDSGVSLRTRSREAELEAADECRLSREGDRRDLSCRWRFPDRAQALAFFEPLLARMSRCLGTGLTETEVAGIAPGREATRRHQALITAPYSQTRVELAVIEPAGTAGEGPAGFPSHVVQLTVEFEQGD